MNKYDLVRCRHKTKNTVKNMPFHITQKAFFKKDWVVEDNGVQEEKILQDPNDLTALRVKVAGMGMKTTSNTTKNEMIAFMNEPKTPSDEPKVETKKEEPKKIEVTEKLPSLETKKVKPKAKKKPKKKVAKKTK